MLFSYKITIFWIKFFLLIHHVIMDTARGRMFLRSDTDRGSTVCYMEVYEPITPQKFNIDYL